MESKRIYLDYSATAPMSRETVEAMLPYMTEKFGNPSSAYSIGIEAKQAIEDARKTIAATIDARPEEIYFTGGGTESDNWAVKAVPKAYGFRGNHIITSQIEHHAVLHACQVMESEGYAVTYVAPEEDGVILPSSVEKALTPSTVLISVMAANNEIGTIEPYREIADLAKQKGILFHTDAVQAYGKTKISVADGKISMLSTSAHKIGGPKGVGFLYVRRDVKLPSLLSGGAQEKRRRAGTENVAGIVGFAKAAQRTIQTMEETQKRETELSEYMIRRVLAEIPYSRLTGSATNRLHGHASFCFQYVEGETILILLDSENICASSGSACTTGQTEPSHVLTAIGLPEDIAHGSLRFSMGPATTREEIDFTINCLKTAVSRVRDMSPMWERRNMLRDERTGGIR